MARPLPLEKLAKPTQRALAGAGIHTLEQLAQYSEKEFLQLHGIGKKALQVLKTALAEQNLSFASPPRT
ncbi:helix-hairpin-helix domain-containing protein [Larkinella sp. VNQ87]|uniref:helix-hairpin-helix domain-containing protein n=1 Tax=Larkinella sp. VNQ87 TaxID=3400921 RepID=UPI003C0773A7